MRLFLLILFSSCQVIPADYASKLTGTWTSTETIATSDGNQDITYTQTFSDVYNITIDDPTAETVAYNTYYYNVGYYPPKYAYVFRDIADESIVVGLPVYFYFEGDTLVTSTNANMSLPRYWTQ